jgi:hypothetical protein
VRPAAPGTGAGAGAGAGAEALPCAPGPEPPRAARARRGEARRQPGGRAWPGGAEKAPGREEERGGEGWPSRVRGGRVRTPSVCRTPLRPTPRDLAMARCPRVVGHGDLLGLLEKVET